MTIGTVVLIILALVVGTWFAFLNPVERGMLLAAIKVGGGRMFVAAREGYVKLREAIAQWREARKKAK